MVVRYDQLADRWLYVMPIFQRIKDRPDEPWSFCYAVSKTPDPLGEYYRYEFRRKLFPDYPRPAIWPDGYYVPTSTGDTVIQKHDCIVDRAKMLKGEAATEQCIVIDGVSFLNNADLDGTALPPRGAPNIMMAAGGAQLNGMSEHDDKYFQDDGMYYWKVHVDWQNPANTKAIGPTRIPVAPYHFLCNGQLSNCVPEPGTETRLDSQGDKLMQRLVYRNFGHHQSILAAHSIDSSPGKAGGVRWYEFRINRKGDPVLYQQSTYSPDGSMAGRPVEPWIAGTSASATPSAGDRIFVGQRSAASAARPRANRPWTRRPVLAVGEGVQATSGNRWRTNTTTVIDPSDDCTFWYIGDYSGGRPGDKHENRRLPAPWMPPVARALPRIRGHGGTVARGRLPIVHPPQSNALGPLEQLPARLLPCSTITTTPVLNFFCEWSTSGNRGPPLRSRPGRSPSSYPP